MFKAEIENFKQYWPAHLLIHVPWGFWAMFLVAQYGDWGLASLDGGGRATDCLLESAVGRSSPSGRTPSGLTWRGFMAGPCSAE